MTGDSWPKEVSWELACDGLAPIRGGVLYSETHTVPQGSCTLRLMDSYGDGWQTATWTAPDWTDHAFTLAQGSQNTVSFYAGPQPPSPPASPPGPPLTCGPGTSANDNNNQCEIVCGSGGRRAAEEPAAEEAPLEPSPVRQLMEDYLELHPHAASMDGELLALMETSLKAISTLTTHPEAASMMESMAAQLFLQPAPA